MLNVPVELSLVDQWYTSRQARRGEGSAPRYDPAEARRLLDQAGWCQRSRDGLRERGGQEFRFTALVLRTTSDPDARDQAHREMSDLLRRDQPITFLLRGVFDQVTHRRVRGLAGPWRADPLMFTEDLWLEKGA